MSSWAKASSQPSKNQGALRRTCFTLKSSGYFWPSLMKQVRERTAAFSTGTVTEGTDLACAGEFLAGEQRHQRRLSRAVAAEEAVNAVLLQLKLMPSMACIWP